jgi:hypothetical protein
MVANGRVQLRRIESATARRIARNPPRRQLRFSRHRRFLSGYRKRLGPELPGFISRGFDIVENRAGWVSLLGLHGETLNDAGTRRTNSP